VKNVGLDSHNGGEISLQKTEANIMPELEIAEITCFAWFHKLSPARIANHWRFSRRDGQKTFTSTGSIDVSYAAQSMCEVFNV